MEDWSVKEVVDYLHAHDLIGVANIFESEEIDGEALTMMTYNDVLDMVSDEEWKDKVWKLIEELTTGKKVINNTYQPRL